MPNTGKASVGGVGPGTALKVESVATSLGTNTSTGAAVSAPAVTSGVAFTPSPTTDSMVYVQIAAAAAGSVTVKMGPATGAENTIVNALAILIGSPDVQQLRVPANWKVIVTVVTVTIAQTIVVTC